jgi:hypothetical protein
MNTQANESRYLPLLIGGIAVILFSTAAIARIIGWIPASTGGSGGVGASDDRPMAATAQMTRLPMAGEARARGRCAECGVIVSTQEIHARDESGGPRASGRSVARSPNELRMTSARRYETVIRLADRSSRMINHASPASWRPGERVIVIDGANPSNR